MTRACDPIFSKERLVSHGRRARSGRSVEWVLGEPVASRPVGMVTMDVWFFFLFCVFSLGDGLRLNSLVKDLKARHEELLARLDRLEARLAAAEPPGR